MEKRNITGGFSGAKVILFAVPGAFTPACSEKHLPGYESLHDDLIAAGADKVACLSVNDAFVMNQCARSQSIEKVMMLPDGNAEFTRKMGMLVSRESNGMGMRSWRYSMFVEDGSISKIFSESGLTDNPPGVPLKHSDAQTMLNFFRSR
ncbi:peroxiredoxin [Roseibium hamelinense]|uniref:Glutathione-dependent peroxiredoxin n=1 Tax=Roseibium hamelinense TaxID=150831 RepID=A0A562SYM0_9HYPH|nr:redoxin family protein [Roseibium hamelinense]TWI86054.1 peroxiredoxin [Roseibium hamelinense]